MTRICHVKQKRGILNTYHPPPLPQLHWVNEERMCVKQPLSSGWQTGVCVCSTPGIGTTCTLYDALAPCRKRNVRIAQNPLRFPSVIWREQHMILPPSRKIIAVGVISSGFKIKYGYYSTGITVRVLQYGYYSTGLPATSRLHGVTVSHELWLICRLHFILTRACMPVSYYPTLI